MTEEETEDIGVEITRYVRNGVSYPQKTVGNCIVCNHPDRLSIETMHMQGYRAHRIIQSLGNDITVNSRNIQSHFRNGHVAPNRELVVGTMLSRAADQGITLEDWNESQRQEISVAEMTVNKFRGRLIEDEDFVPDFKEGLAAAKLLYEMNSGEDTSFDPTYFYVALSIFMAHTRSVIAAFAGEDVQAAMDTLTNLLQSDPVLKTLISRTRSVELPPMIDSVDEEEEEGIYEGEVVETMTNTTPEPAEDIPFDEPDDE